MRLFEFFSGSLPNGAGTLELNPPHLLHPNSSLFLFDQLYRCGSAKMPSSLFMRQRAVPWTSDHILQRIFKVMESDYRAEMITDPAHLVVEWDGTG